ncbi:MAG: radical SAM protein, partial [Planctomycetota bacterium]
METSVTLNRSKHKYVFGPVPSRRLGRSLGIDLVPLKTCSFNCIYCQLGRGKRTVTERDEFVPLEAVLQELTEALADAPPPDYITLSGSGEPTLYERLGELIGLIKGVSPAPVAILTNGSTLSDANVRADCGRADVILPTLAAHSEEQYQRIHRPAPGMTLERHVEGLRAFRREQETRMWLELFLLEGVNASDDDLQAFAKLLDRIRPHAIQLNTAVRPTAERYAFAVAPA